MTQPLVTVALCTHNHLDRLQQTLAALQTLQGPAEGWEVLVVDNASNDGTAEFLRRPDWRPATATARVAREARLGISHARNCAVDQARGKYILFIDDDETPHEAWLINHAAAMLQWQADALGGPVHVLFINEPRPAWLQDELLGFLGRLEYGDSSRWLTEPHTPIFTGNAAFRRAVFDRVGGFDVGLGRLGSANFGGEDIEMYERMQRSGCRIRWVPDAIIFHRIDSSKLRRGYFLDLHFRYGRTEGARGRGGRSRIPPPHLLPQLLRAMRNAVSRRMMTGADASLRREMNVAYFLGYLAGWMRD